MFDELSKIHTIEITNEVPFSVSGNSTAEDQLLEDEETKLIKEQVNNAMNTLTSRQREAIYLYYIEELSYDQICLLLDMNYQSVRNLIHRGMTRLRENMDRKTFLFL
jgi:RNA polymerase sigma factor (sigma-70 family)